MTMDIEQQDAIPSAPVGRSIGLSQKQVISILLPVTVLALFFASMALGTIDVPLGDLLPSLFAHNDATQSIIVQEVRLPRALLAVIVGATLGMSGAALQGLLRNPLADPALLGTSTSAALGAVIALYFGFFYALPVTLPLFAVVFSVGSIFLLYALAGRNSDILTLILAGVALASISGAGISVAINLSPDAHSTMEIVFWLMGSLADRSMTHVWLCLPFALIGWAMLMGCGKGLDALSLGEDAARSMGIDLKRLRFRVIVGTSIAVGGAVAVSGSIGFIGLVMPHLLRPIFAHKPSALLWASAMGGAALLLAADIGVRVIPTNAEMKIGVLTALVGAPFFLFLVFKTRMARDQ